MSTDTLTRLVPLADALAALDSFEGRTDRHRRAVELSKSTTGEARGKIIYAAGHLRLAAALAPRALDTWDAASRDAAERQVSANVDALVVEQLVDQLRRSDEQAIYDDPDRREDQRVWSAYLRLVSSVAATRGNKSDTFVDRWRTLLADRAEAVAVGESTLRTDRTLASMDVPYPALPGAAWDTADLLNESDRLAEFERLEARYGPREFADVTPSTSTRRSRKIRGEA